jgi:hypothetical protein
VIDNDEAQALAKQVRALAAAVDTPVQLWVAYGLLADLEGALTAAGQRLHRNGASWAALAAPFGITRQGARKRWATDDGEQR